ncbi:MAG: peptidase S15 [Acidobacteria bacterium]|nr:MAG: peptidase S15 [Acidobacteriota bacterium]
MFRSVIVFFSIFAISAFAALPPSPPVYGIRMVQAWIPMKDGIRLSATLYMPDSTKPGEKFPALLDYLPYRKDDAMAAGDYSKHAYFAHRGYVSTRVDIRGFGSSEGRLPEREYSEQEQTDGEQVIAWLATQPWSNGSVGMFGISWGGFNSIQMAMRNTPHLKAIIAIAATDQLFHDDVHYVDGFELNMDMAEGFAVSPEYALDDYVLNQRFETPPWSLLYMRHQRDGSFWRSPVRPQNEIKIPCFLIGGFADGYRDSIPHMLQNVKAPVRALIGPWNHSFPNNADFGPRVEWRDQAVRWWDYWLKGRDTGVLNDPRLIVFMRHWYPPDPNLESVPGQWRIENSWPPEGQKEKTLYLQPNHTLADSIPAPHVHQLKYVPSIGVEAGFWWGELLADQRPVDAFSLVYDSAPLQEDVAILGWPHAHLRASAPVKLADWFARLSDVAPDGSVTQLTGAGLNGAQRDSTADPRDLEPNKMYALDIEMHLTSWVFPQGHRIRVSISNAQWPMIWPTPYNMTTSLALGGDAGSRLVLPFVPEKGAPGRVPLSAPEPTEERKDIHSVGYPWPGEWTLLRDEGHQKSTVLWKGKSETDYPWGKETDYETMTYELEDAHPEANGVQGEAETIYQLQGRTLTWRGHLAVTSDEKNFFYKYTREVLRDGKLVKQKSWEETIPRDHQ